MARPVHLQLALDHPPSAARHQPVIELPDSTTTTHTQKKKVFHSHFHNLFIFNYRNIIIIIDRKKRKKKGLKVYFVIFQSKAAIRGDHSFLVFSGENSGWKWTPSGETQTISGVKWKILRLNLQCISITHAPSNQIKSNISQQKSKESNNYAACTVNYKDIQSYITMKPMVTLLSKTSA